MRDRKNAPDFPRNRPGVLVASEVHVQRQAEEKPKSSVSGRGKSRQFFYLQWQSISYLFSPEIKRQHNAPLTAPKQEMSAPLGHLEPADQSERRLHEGSKACFRMKGSLIGASRDTSDERLDGEEYVGRKASSRIRYGPNTSRQQLCHPDRHGCHTPLPIDLEREKKHGFSGGDYITKSPLR